MILTALQLSDGRDELDLMSLVNEDVVHSERLRLLADSFGSMARVGRAKVMFNENRQLTCDFSRSSVSTVTRSTVLLSELLGVGLPLLRSMAAETVEELRDLLRQVGGSVQPTLLDEDESLEDPLF